MRITTYCRALGIGVNSTHHDGVPVVTFADKAEGLDAAAQLAATNGVDLWLVEDGHASLLSRHRPTEAT